MTDEIELKLDEDNEVLFRVAVEGTKEPASVRFVCENGDVSYMFKGTSGEEPGEVKINVPPMQKQLAEGTYSSRLEVLIENKYFSPIQLNVRFKKGVSVVAEAVVSPPKKMISEIRVAASPVVVKKAQPQAAATPVQQTLKERALAKQSRELTEEEILSAAERFVSQQRSRR